MSQIFVNMPWESAPKNGRFKTKSFFKWAFHWQLKHTALSKRFDNTWQDMWMQMRISGEYSDNSHSNWETHMADMCERIFWMISRCICPQFLPRTDQHGVGRTQRICTTQTDIHTICKNTLFVKTPPHNLKTYHLLKHPTHFENTPFVKTPHTIWEHTIC